MRRSSTKGADSQQALKDNARGLCLWKVGLLTQDCSMGALGAQCPQPRRWPWNEAWRLTTRRSAR